MLAMLFIDSLEQVFQKTWVLSIERLHQLNGTYQNTIKEPGLALINIIVTEWDTCNFYKGLPFFLCAESYIYLEGYSFLFMYSHQNITSLYSGALKFLYSFLSHHLDVTMVTCY